MIDTHTNQKKVSFEEEFCLHFNLQIQCAREREGGSSSEEIEEGKDRKVELIMKTNRAKHSSEEHLG